MIATLGLRVVSNRLSYWLFTLLLTFAKKQTEQCLFERAWQQRHELWQIRVDAKQTELVSQYIICYRLLLTIQNFLRCVVLPAPKIRGTDGCQSPSSIKRHVTATSAPASVVAPALPARPPSRDYAAAGTALPLARHLRRYSRWTVGRCSQPLASEWLHQRLSHKFTESG